jgi:hypothetical protein
MLQVLDTHSPASKSMESATFNTLAGRHLQIIVQFTSKQLLKILRHLTARKAYLQVTKTMQRMQFKGSRILSFKSRSRSELIPQLQSQSENKKIK